MIDDAAAICRYAPNAVPVTWQGLSSCGPLDEEDREGVDGSGVFVRERVMVLRVPTTHLEDIARGDEVKVTRRGVQTTYRVREVSLEDDGEVKALSLARLA
jgi:hypothetical protein